MAIEAAIEHLKEYDAETRVRVFDVSSATVELAALALGVEPQRIAKTLAFPVQLKDLYWWLPLGMRKSTTPNSKPNSG